MNKLTSKDSKDVQLVENHLKQREVSTEQRSADALREDFRHLIDGQQEMHDEVGKLKGSILDLVESNLIAVNDLQNCVALADIKRKTGQSSAVASASSSRRGSLSVFHREGSKEALT